MLNLEKGMLLYHGSYTVVEHIDLDCCRTGKDFGRGFYLTTSLPQAKAFVPLSLKRKYGADISGKTGFVSVYQLDSVENLKCYAFATADRDWLHFVAANRRQGLFDDLLREFEKYDVVTGKIADDRTAVTLQLYVSGVFGRPGSDAADKVAISMLLPDRLENQFCFRTGKAVALLKFVKQEGYQC